MPRTLHPAEIRVLRRLSYIPTGSLSDLATAAMISPKAISRVWNSLHHMRLVHFYDDAAGNFVRGLTDAGRAELGKWGWRVESAHIPTEVARAQQLPQEPTPAVEPMDAIDRTLQDDEAVCAEAARESKERSAPARMFLPTPTPWCVHKFPSRSGYTGGFGFQLRGDKGGMTTIGSLTPGSTTDRVESISEANAAFIVRAVNAHDALVAFVERAPCFCDGPACAPDGLCTRCTLLKQAQA